MGRLKSGWGGKKQLQNALHFENQLGTPAWFLVGAGRLLHLSSYQTAPVAWHAGLPGFSSGVTVLCAHEGRGSSGQTNRHSLSSLPSTPPGTPPCQQGQELPSWASVGGRALCCWAGNTGWHGRSNPLWGLHRRKLAIQPSSRHGGG